MCQVGVLMEHSKLQELKDRIGPVGRCEWCGRWVPIAQTSQNGYLRSFLGTKMCNSCYIKFKRTVNGMTNPALLAKWLEKNVRFDIKIEIEGVEYKKKENHP